VRAFLFLEILMRDRLNLSAAWLLAFALCALSIFTSIAHATDLKVTCTPSTTNTDGTPITAAQGAATFSLYGSLQGQARQKLVSGATTCSFTRTAVAFGTQEYQVTQTNLNIESPMSVTVSSVVPPPTPGAPTNTVVVQLVAYEMRGTASDGNLRMVSVGYVAEGTQCMQTQATVAGVAYQQVEKAKVDLYNALSKLPPVTWARCG
jgi:hypothetical protein